MQGSERRRCPLLLPGLVGAALLLSGCDVIGDEPLSEPYRFLAIDFSDNMVVCRSTPGGGCVGEYLPRPTVFAAGANARYVVIARRLANANGQNTNLGVTEYYYVVRRAADDFQRQEDLTGPLTRAEFDAATKRLNLPGFSRVFRNLQ